MWRKFTEAIPDLQRDRPVPDDDEDEQEQPLEEIEAEYLGVLQREQELAIEE